MGSRLKNRVIKPSWLQALTKEDITYWRRFVRKQVKEKYGHKVPH